MRTIAQQQEQTAAIICCLEKSLKRLVFIDLDQSTMTAIYWHCAMILYYRRLSQLLQSRNVNSIFNQPHSSLSGQSVSACLNDDVSDIDWKNQLTYWEALDSVLSGRVQEYKNALEALSPLLQKMYITSIVGIVAGLLAMCLAVLVILSLATFLSNFILGVSLVIAVGSLVYFDKLEPVVVRARLSKLKQDLTDRRIEQFMKETDIIDYAEKCVPALQGKYGRSEPKKCPPSFKETYTSFFRISRLYKALLSSELQTVAVALYPQRN